MTKTNHPALFDPERRYFPILIIGIIQILLLIWIISIPPFQNADEGAHFIKACANPVVESYSPKGYGHYFNQGFNDLNKQADFQLIRKGEAKFSFEKFFSHPIYGSDKERFYPHAVPNTIVPYLLPFITCKTLQAADTQYQYLFYALRLSFATSFILLLWFSQKLGKDIFYSIAPLLALPMVINQAAALSADYFSIGSALVFGIAASRMIQSDNQARWALAWALFFMLNTKVVYLPFAAILIIPTLRWKAYRTTYFWLPSIALGSVAIALQYYYQTTKTYFAKQTNSQHEQLDRLLTNPLDAADMLLNSIIHSWQFYLKGMIGYAGWFTTPISNQLMWIAVATVLIWIFIGIQRVRFLDNWGIATLVTGSALVAVSVLGIFLSMLLYWTPYESDRILGVQGRYFLPSLVFLATLIFGQAKEQPPRIFQLAALLSMGGITAAFLIQSVIPSFH